MSDFTETHDRLLKLQDSLLRIAVEQVTRLEGRIAELCVSMVEAEAILAAGEVGHDSKASDILHAAVVESSAEHGRFGLGTCETCRHVYVGKELSTPCPHCLIEEMAACAADLHQALFDSGRGRIEAVLEIARLAEALTEYGEHQRDCNLAHFEAGEPTPDGGYRTKFAGIWYERGQEPDCSCGLHTALGHQAASG